MSSKVKQLTVESFYRKRLCAVDPIWEEYYLKIAEKLVEKGYESPRLLDNIIESLPREFNPEFYSVMIKVNPKMHDNSHLAEKKMGKAIVAQLVETSFLKEITAEEDPQIAQKQKQQTQVKKQILQKKLIAVRSGAQDVTASHEPEGEMVEGNQRDPEGSKKDRTHSKQPDPSKDGFTGIGNMSIKDIMKMNAKIKAKSKKESVEPEEEMVEAKVDAGKSPETKEKDRNVRKFGVSHNVAGHGKLRRALHRSNRGDKKIPGDKPQLEVEGVVDQVKKGVKRHKDAVEKKKVANRKAVPYTALAAETDHEGSVVVEKIKNIVREKIINELKNSTLLSYSQKATNQLAFKGDGSKKSQKRATGIKTATGRLALRATDPDGKLGVNKNPKNEEVEHVDEKISASGYARAKKWREEQAREKDRKNNPAYYAEVDKIRAAKAKRAAKKEKNLASNMKKEEIILDYLKERDLPESIIEKLSEEQKTYIMDLYIEQSENINGSVGEVQGESL